ncbi:MAG TPA: FMN-binding protein [Devosiaceae bacterium]
MRKLLLSVAFLAASGAYAVQMRQTAPDGLALAGDLGGTDSAGAAIAPASASSGVTLALPTAQPAAITVAPAPQVTAKPAPGTMTILSVEPPARIANATYPVPVAAPAAPRPAVSAPDPAVPADSPAPLTAAADPQPVIPLPRIRPASAPQATMQVLSADMPAQQQASLGFKDGVYRGPSANAYYGRVQVAAVVQGGRIVAIQILDYPSDRRTSRYINSIAMPRLQREAVQAQSANINMVSGATLSSNAFLRSLNGALSAAKA